jgi:hypothetical protein
MCALTVTYQPELRRIQSRSTSWGVGVRDMSDRRIALLVLLIVCLMALALGVALAWHSFLSNQASAV